MRPTPQYLAQNVFTPKSPASVIARADEMPKSDDFGDFDDEALVEAATQLENSQGDSDISPRPTKRRRINRRLSDEVDEDESDDSPAASRLRVVVRNSDDEDDLNPAPHSARTSIVRRPFPPPDIVKKPPKHKIHIPANVEIFKDAYLTQAPPASSNPWSIRGPMWRKRPQHEQAVVPVKAEPEPHPRRLVVEETVLEDDPIDGEAVLQQRASHAFFQKPRSPEKPTVQRPSGPAPVQRPTSNNNNTNGIPPSRPEIVQSVQSPQTQFDINQELADLPSDAFASSSSSPQILGDDPINISSQPSVSPVRRTNLVGPQTGLRQTTLFGGTVQQLGPQSQATKRHNFPLVTKDQPPTHHKLNDEALATWVYPTNLGTTRDYQFNIVARGLFNNLLVALPTGLGKTFIAATIMLNWFRWTKDAQIVFVAPTKPLVSQQVEACFQIVGIPRSETVMLTGTISPGLRAEEWSSKRVFFMTPQTIVNDLKTGICDPKRIALLVVDEAHRATGGYAYVEVVKFIKRFNQSFRVLALTATPGSAVESVQEVIDGLDIARVEIRTESSLDIRQYVHSRKTETVLFDYSAEQEMCMDLFSKALQSSVNRLRQHNAYWSADPMSLTAYGLTQARQRWMASDAGRNAHWGVKGPVNLLFTMLASLAHSIELLKYHGIAPFYHGVLAFRNGVDEGGGKSKQRQAINQDENFEKLMVRLRGWINDPDFIGHPKLEYLQSVVLNHFMDAGEGRAADGAPPSSTRIMIFAHYRDSAEEIVRVLKRNEPMIRPHVFVGQASSKGSEGMDQKRQLDVIQKFKAGVYNTLVATSIGEEGLDIGEIDLIICYDSSASPIRMLQRMGRTGRKRAGNIVLLLMKGKEEKSFESARDNYEKIQSMIASGTRFNFHDDRSPRIVPKDIQPVVDKRVVEIPPENTQADMPEPKRRGRAPKRPPKKFHMPDGVRTGFVKASRIDDGASDEGPTRVKRSKKQLLIAPPVVEKEPLPSLEEVLLNKVQERELERKYQHVYDGDGAQTVTGPRLGAFPLQLQKLGQTKYVKHGRTTTQTAKMLGRVHRMDEASVDILSQALHMSDVEPDRSPEHASNHDEEAEQATPSSVRRPGMKSGDFAAAMEAPTSSAPKTPACMQLPTQGIDLGNDTSGNDQEESTDSELDNFVVDDAASIAPFTSSIPASAAITQKFYVSQEPRQSSVSEDDLPEITTLVQTRNTDPEFRQTNRKVLDRVEILSSSPVVRRTMKKRRVVEESDSE
ncbi:hypothetical protein LTR04_005980 [Oleoguttula sp. CCFEE 6159]|nr:hypothetical protein LTR04_005980 [Oleoguttula sp. CCFEE 6159]